MSESCGVILLYHRVTDIPTDPQLLAVGPRHFAQQLEVLGRIARVMPLREMLRHSRQRTLPPNAVAITFDDGYADNLLEARPLLARYGTPATVYIATAGIGRPYEFFSDELDRIFLQPGTLPPSLRLTIGAREYESSLNEFATYTRAQWEQHRRWNVLDSVDPTARQRLYREVCTLLHHATSAQRRAAIADLQKWAGIGREGRRSHRMLTAAEVRRLAEDDLVEIGAHTRTHPLLPVETIEDQRDEMAGSKADIEAMLGRPVPGLSYPFGTRRDYTSDTVAAAREAGFEYACSNFPGKLTHDTSAFELPRFIVRDWNAATFGKKLENYLNWAPRIAKAA